MPKEEERGQIDQLQVTDIVSTKSKVQERKADASI